MRRQTSNPRRSTHLRERADLWTDYAGAVFFATARVEAGRWYYRFLSRLIRVLTHSDIAHCTVGFGGASVLDPTFEGNVYWPLEMFLDRYPTLHSAFLVPFTHAIDLEFFGYGVGQPKRHWPTFYRWLRRGVAPWTEDCLCITLACLMAGGVDVPERIYTPVQLHDWLTDQGYPHVRASDAADARRFRDSARRLVAGEVAG